MPKTSIKEMEAALCEYKEKYRRLEENIPGMVYKFVLHPNGNVSIVYVSAASRELFDAEPEDIIKNKASLVDKIHPDDREKLYQSIRRSAESLSPWREELRHIVNDKVRWYDCMSRPEKQPNGDIVWDGIIMEITERRRVEEALWHSEKRYRSFVEVTSQFAWMTDANGQVVEDIPSWRSFTGQTYEQAKGTGWSTALHPQDLQHALEVWNRAVTTKEHYEVEYRVRRYDGVYRVMLARGAPILDEQNNIVEWVGTCIDITERKEAEEALAKEQHLLNALLDTIPDNIYFKDRDSRFIRINKALASWLGLADPSEALGRSDFDFFSEEHARQAFADEQEIIRTGQPLVGIEEKETWPDSEDTWVSTTKIPLRDDEGNTVGILGISRDITEHKRAEQALQESEERFRSLYENSTIGLYRTTPDGRILMANPTTIKMLGYNSFEELAKRNLERSGYEPSYSRSEFVQRLEKDGVVTGLESAWLKRDGTTIFIRESARAIRDENGKVIYYDGSFEDITDRKKAEEQIQKDLTEKEVLLKEIHHRVKNNLQIISSLLNLQASQLHDEQALAAFEESKNRIYSMALIHEQLYRSLNFSNIQMKDYVQTLTRELIRAYRVFGRIEITAKVDNTSLGIDKAIPCGLILNELITNSIKYAFPEGSPGRIDVSLKTLKDSTHEIKVHDNGVGLSKYIDFENLESLGLHLVKVLTEQLDGSVEISGGKGTTFIIHF
jgi:PAS domain S-box-containing protein